MSRDLTTLARQGRLLARLALAGPPTARPPIEILETLYIDYRTSPPRREVRAA